MIWHIVTDSSCDLRQLHEKQGDIEVRYTSVPFIITVESKDFVDDDDLVLEEMLSAMEISREASHTSCPTPQSWEDAFRQEGNVIALTISKELSGSHNSACVAREMVLEEQPDKNILVVNSASTGPALVGLIRVLTAEILAGRSFEEVSAKALETTERMQTVFALCSFDNLVKNGRMSKLTGFIARTLGFWGIGVASPQGTIVIKGKERSTRKVIASILADMTANIPDPRLVFISHCQNADMANRIREAVLEKWPNVLIEAFETRGLDSYYAERHGLLVSYL